MNATFGLVFLNGNAPLLFGTIEALHNNSESPISCMTLGAFMYSFTPTGGAGEGGGVRGLLVILVLLTGEGGGGGGGEGESIGTNLYMVESKLVLACANLV